MAISDLDCNLIYQKISWASKKIPNSLETSFYFLTCAQSLLLIVRSPVERFLDLEIPISNSYNVTIGGNIRAKLLNIKVRRLLSGSPYFARFYLFAPQSFSVKSESTTLSKLEKSIAIKIENCSNVEEQLRSFAEVQPLPVNVQGWSSASITQNW